MYYGVGAPKGKAVQSKTLKMLLTTMVLIPIAILITLFALGQVSRSGQAPGLVERKLSPCPDKPNCLCSDHPVDAPHFIEPLQVNAQGIGPAWQDLRESIEALGGRVQVARPDYLAATFKSKLFGFVDDLEARVDLDDQVLHIRSASRVGHSDLGANQTRITSLRTQYERRQQQRH